MDTKLKELVKTNESFYLAIKNSDFDQMKTVWLQDSSVKCVHPGWPMLHGWEAVSQSWKKIFENGAPIDIELVEVETEISGNSAWVICIEKISYKIENEIHSGFAQSTNIFKLDGELWQLALHHASPIPAPRGDVSTTDVLQ
ncbi:MAG: nuclear transport factor 2 family protein [Thermodesulfobacteriota bacterium]